MVARLHYGIKGVHGVMHQAPWSHHVASEPLSQRDFGSDKNTGRREAQETDVLAELTAMVQFVFDVEA